MYELAAILPGLDVAPLAVLLGICTVAWVVARGLADVAGLIPYVWHSALFFGAVWVIIAGLATLWMLGGDAVQPRAWLVWQ